MINVKPILMFYNKDQKEKFGLAFILYWPLLWPEQMLGVFHVDTSQHFPTLDQHLTVKNDAKYTILVNFNVLQIYAKCRNVLY